MMAMTANKEIHPQLIHDRTDLADASLSPHPPLVAQDHTASERQRASEHMRATQWAYAHFSMVVESDPWEQDEDNGDGDGWSDWEQSDSSSLDSGTPDWRGVNVSVIWHAYAMPALRVIFFCLCALP